MSCDYCDERAGRETVYNRVYGRRNRVVFETERFTVFPCMGQLREGHLLAASKAHVNAAGMLDRDAAAELEDVIAAVGAFYKTRYRQGLLCFEHGVLDDGGSCGGCGIYHMHLHLLPASFREFAQVRRRAAGRDTHSVERAAGLSDTRRCVEGRETYLFLSYRDGDSPPDSSIIRSRDNYFESQYMRKIVSAVFGGSDWDWRKATREEPVFLKTLAVCREYFGGRALCTGENSPRPRAG